MVVVIIVANTSSIIEVLRVVVAVIQAVDVFVNVVVAVDSIFDTSALTLLQL